jgi:hypothetical protein
MLKHDGHEYTHAREFLAVTCALFVVNALWLASFKARGTAEAPQMFWCVNNIAFALIAFVAWMISSPAMCAFSAGGALTLLWVAVGICLVNSAIDLRFTAWAYLVGTPG